MELHTKAKNYYFVFSPDGGRYIYIYYSLPSPFIFECWYLVTLVDVLSASLPAWWPATPGDPQPVLGRDDPAGDGAGAQLPPQTGHGRVDDEGDEEHKDGEGGEE